MFCNMTKFSISKNKIKLSSLLFCHCLLLGNVSFFSFAKADTTLTREEIMRQHQALEREHEGGASSASGDGLAPPVASSDNGESFDGSSTSNTGSVAVGKGDNNLTAQLLERVSALEGQVRQLRGEVDTLTNKLQQDEANTSKQFGDMQFALQNNGGAGHVTLPKAAAKSEDKNFSSGKQQPQTALEALKQARSSLKQHHYPEAEKLARYALANAHSLSGKIESRYLVATSLAGEKQYHQSATEYYDIYSKEPKSSYAPDALLGLAYSMFNAGSKSAACEALAKLGKEYPSSMAHNGARAKAISEKASCHH